MIVEDRGLRADGSIQSGSPPRPRHPTSQPITVPVTDSWGAAMPRRASARKSPRHPSTSSRRWRIQGRRLNAAARGAPCRAGGSNVPGGTPSVACLPRTQGAFRAGVGPACRRRSPPRCRLSPTRSACPRGCERGGRPPALRRRGRRRALVWHLPRGGRAGGHGSPPTLPPRQTTNATRAAFATLTAHSHA